ncbi:MAG: aminoglycoside phosphotransferase family protein [Pirellulales bacterium]
MKTTGRDIVLSDAIEVRPLSGLSGAQVFLITLDGRHWRVRKAAQTPAASERLRGQAHKQAAFAREMQDIVSTPRILDEGEVEGRFYYDMEFVRGPDGTSYLLRASYDEVTRLSDCLCRYLEAAASRPPLSTSASGTLFDALYAKICDIQRATGLISPENLASLFLGLDQVRRLGEVPMTLCHGDLTLENMVIGQDGAICVVDLLDSPFEHYWQDVAKLHQDLSGGWYLLEQQPVAKCVLDFVSRRLLQAATRLHPGYRQVHSLLVATTFARILPYTRTPDETKFVTDRITYFARQSPQPADG